MTNDLINIKISISGKRAVGKTMLVAKLKQIFELLGANVVLEPENLHPLARESYEMSIKDNMAKKCVWDVWNITIQEKLSEDFSFENLEKELMEVAKRLETWNSLQQKDNK